jgi:serine/threonine protein kinase
LETTSFPLDTALDTADVVDDDSDHAASSTSALNFSVPGAPTTHAQSLSTSMLNAGNATSDDDAAAQDGSGQQNISRPDSNTAAAAPPADPIIAMEKFPRGTRQKPDALETAVAPVAPPAVRFSSSVQEREISPIASRQESALAEDTTGLTDDQIIELKKTLEGVHLNDRRVAASSHFEPISLPVSRVPSRDDESRGSSRVSTPISLSVQSPHMSTTHISTATTAMASPPLTPAATDSANRDKKLGARDDIKAQPQDSSLITPQASTSHERPISPRPNLPNRPKSDYGVIRAASAEDQDPRARSHRKGLFSVGAGSTPVSRESSPSRLSASHLYSKPFTPAGEPNDPYAAHRRQPQLPNPSRQSVDARFVFSKKRPNSPHRTPQSLSQRSSMIFGALKLSPDDANFYEQPNNRVGSMADLKRFFKRGHHKKRDASPGAQSGTKTPPVNRDSHHSHHHKNRHGLLFDEGALSSKYGKLGKVLGSGAGGSVRLMKRREDGTVFAVKEFRARHSYETEKQYSKKVTAEFCVGSTLHHGNIIETLDIVQEKGRWYQVMEYAPFDLFAIVMTGRMKREEVTCCFLQILNGVTYLHSMGLAHRDLKLDNVVVSKEGIMKIIDFGSAHVFRYPFENGVVRAKGIVGSDPYLAPEVYDAKDYDAQAADIWSLAIIYCCMTLRRFPWKLPRLTDNSFKLFAAEPTPGHDPKKLLAHHAHKGDSDKESHKPAARAAAAATLDRTHDKGKRAASPTPGGAQASTTSVASSTEETKKEVIKGPWRILRLLPRDSRQIISRMLDLDPTTRATMEEILEEPWVADAVICRQSENGDVTHADDHIHTLEPPAPQPAA